MGLSENSNPHEFEIHRPSIKGTTTLFLKVIKSIIIIIESDTNTRRTKGFFLTKNRLFYFENFLLAKMLCGIRSNYKEVSHAKTHDSCLWCRLCTATQTQERVPTLDAFLQMNVSQTTPFKASLCCPQCLYAQVRVIKQASVQKWMKISLAIMSRLSREWCTCQTRNLRRK